MIADIIQLLFKRRGFGSFSAFDNTFGIRAEITDQANSWTSLCAWRRIVAPQMGLEAEKIQLKYKDRALIVSIKECVTTNCLKFIILLGQRAVCNTIYGPPLSGPRPPRKH